MLYRIVTSEIEDVVGYARVKTQVGYWEYFSEKNCLLSIR
jgi:hypothetical protein